MCCSCGLLWWWSCNHRHMARGILWRFSASGTLLPEVSFYTHFVQRSFTDALWPLPQRVASWPPVLACNLFFFSIGAWKESRWDCYDDNNNNYYNHYNNLYLQAHGIVHYQHQNPLDNKKLKKHKYYKCIRQCQHDKKPGWKWRSTSTVNACINIKAFHTHSNKHKYYRIMHTSMMQPMAAAGKEGKSVTAAWSVLFDREPFPMKVYWSTVLWNCSRFFCFVQCDSCWLIFIATLKSVCFLLNE